MEISRPLKPVLIISAEPPGMARKGDVHQPSQIPTRQAQAESLPLEQMQDALRAMPELDLDRVAAIRLALQRGEISTDPAQLASSMLTYHRGSDV